MTIKIEQPYSLGARWIHTMLADPLENHWVNCADGRVDSISSKPAHSAAQHLGEHSVILPAAINAHAHLELSQLNAPFDVPSRSMSDWVTALMTFRRSAEYDAAKGIQQALCLPELLKSTAAVADIVPAIYGCRESNEAELLDQTRVPAKLSSLKHIPFIELIAWQKDAAEKLNYGIVHTGVLAKLFGLSPHAPHTVCPELLENAIKQKVPLAMHLAETPEELHLLQHHAGPLLDMMRRADPDYQPISVLLGKRPMDYLQLLSAAPKAFIIHGNYLDEEELRFLAGHCETMSVVYCPRSHAYFRHTSYPLKKMLDYGVRVLLGTDSLASVPNLCFAEEMRFAVEQHPSVPPEMIYRLGTIEGAAAFDLLSEGWGTLQADSSAQLLTYSVR